MTTGRINQVAIVSLLAARTDRRPRSRADDPSERHEGDRAACCLHGTVSPRGGHPPARLAKKIHSFTTHSDRDAFDRRLRDARATSAERRVYTTRPPHSRFGRRVVMTVEQW